MNRKIPQDAFGFYFSLGVSRSYGAVAEKYGVSKRAVALLASREQWQPRIAELERKARQRTDELALESLEEMNRRHIKVYKFIQNKAIEALKSMPLDSAMNAVRAYERAAEGERLARAEPGDQEGPTIEAVIKREYALCMRLVEPVEGASEGSAANDVSNEQERSA